MFSLLAYSKPEATEVSTVSVLAPPVPLLPPHILSLLVLTGSS